MILWHGYEIDFPKLKDTDMADLEQYTADLAGALSAELLKFNSTLATLQNDIENLETETAQNDSDLEATKQFIENSMKTMETEGTSIHVTDSADYPCKLRVEGKSEQIQTETSPSPDYPSEIENVSGDLEVKATAKNILPRTFAEDLLKRLNISSTDDYLVEIDGKNYFKFQAGLGYQTGKNYFIQDEFEENAQYVFKAMVMKASSETNGAINIGYVYTDGTMKSFNVGTWTNMTEKEVMLTSDAGKTIKRIGLFYNEGTTYINLDKYILCKLEAGIDTSKLEYEPYKEQTVTFPFSEGQKLMQGGYLGKNGVVNKRKQYIFTGNETLLNYGSTDEYLGFAYVVGGVISNNVGFCNFFKLDAGGAYNKNANSIWIASNNGNGIFRFSVDKNVASTLAEAKSWLAEQYSAGTPVIVEYEMQEEETTAYTSEQQTAYNELQKLKTYRTVTNISNSQDTNMKLTYKKDLQTQFQEIEALVLESGV